MSCLSCGREFHDECGMGNNDLPGSCCCTSSDSATGSGTATEDSKRATTENPEGGAEPKEVTVSAGRKRAAREYDIDENQPCEWRGKINCGGGFISVPGCAFGFQVDRHHGPDKNTTNNSRDNIHLICKNCHNLWHRRNDPLYGEAKYPDGITLHLPKWATLSEIPSLIVKEDV